VDQVAPVVLAADRRVVTTVNRLEPEGEIDGAGRRGAVFVPHTSDATGVVGVDREDIRAGLGPDHVRVP